MDNPDNLDTLRLECLQCHNAAMRIHNLQAVIKELWHESEMDNRHMNEVYHQIMKYLTKKENEKLRDVMHLKGQIKLTEIESAALEPITLEDK